MGGAGDCRSIYVLFGLVLQKQLSKSLTVQPDIDASEFLGGGFNYFKK